MAMIAKGFTPDNLAQLTTYLDERRSAIQALLDIGFHYSAMYMVREDAKVVERWADQEHAKLSHCSWGRDGCNL